MKQILVSPSILNADFTKLKKECISLQEAGADMIHCDVMDGVFVPNTTFGVERVAEISHYVNLPLDVHLMVSNPLQVVEEYASVGAKIITFHVEAESDIYETAKLIRKNGAKVGLSIKPNTPVETLIAYNGLFDMILIMSVEPGFGGQRFLPLSLQKIALAKQLFPTIPVQVDGGINLETAPLVVEAGADILVAGSAIIGASDRKSVIKNLKTL